ncbi:MAG: sigma 54-interacting transcriptional regulator [Deltaproteobacteria bacterium]|jgi:DNA-binding NtrC family response regulator|nr:sigma 54-interacting transcriptional regulator [Deltaproteobacteria bacterium]
MDSGNENFPDFIPPTKIAYISGRPATLHLRKCKLVMERSDGSPAEYIFDQPTVTLGAMDDNDIVVDDDTVSRYHCRISQDDDAWVIQDLGSTNGTFVNRVRIKEAFLKPGCLVTVGKTDVRFQSLDERVEITPANRDRFGRIVGTSIRMREIFGILEKIAPSGVTVVIEGETGTGKEVVARTIHEASRRIDKPFVVFDCGAVPENLIESELFGHEKGSFTGAIMARQGLFENAQGGTIFLDELGELSLDLQPKLLRALEQREIRRVGSNKPIKIDVRVIAATNRNLAEEVKAGRFREDLFYRLSVVRLILPPLRERKEDLPHLTKHILLRAPFNKDQDGNPRVKGVSREGLDAMMSYEWPGNVRELVNVVERACAYAEGEYVGLEDMPEQISGIGIVRRRPNPEAATARDRIEKIADKPFKEAKEEWLSSFERDYIFNLLKRNSFNISHAAREADIDRKYFRKLMKKYGIEGDGPDD